MEWNERQIDKVAKAMYMLHGNEDGWNDLPLRAQNSWRNHAKAGLNAIGGVVDEYRKITDGYAKSASLEYRDSLIEEGNALRKERDLIYRQLIELEVRTGQARADLGDDDPLVRAKKATERLGKVKTD